MGCRRIAWKTDRERTPGVAELNGEPVGSILRVDAGGSVAKLRLRPVRMFGKDDLVNQVWDLPLHSDTA